MKTLGITFKELLESGMVKWEDLISVYVPKLLPGNKQYECILTGQFFDDAILKYLDRQVTDIKRRSGFLDVWIAEKEV